ncbi:MAG: ABC transporter substrate-binding protein [Hyphomicrobiales bacterium]
MTKRILGVILVAAMVFGAAAFAVAAQKLVVYTSMKESLISELQAAFLKTNPGIDMDYQSAGAGKLMAKIAAERESGKILADVLWTSEVPDFYQLRSQGMLEKYISPEVKNAVNPLADFDGSFTPARLGTLGIGYNTRFIKEPPQTWQDLFKPQFKGAFGIANPALSGTAYVSVSMLAKAFGWEFFQKLKANGAKMGKGSGQVVDDTASGDLVASLAVDYITNDKIEKGATLALAYPPELLVIPSPVTIFKGTPNLEAAKKFVDFLLSKEAQVIIAHEGTLPVRPDVQVQAKFNLPKPQDALTRGIKVDYPQMIAVKEETIKKFTDIMQGK